MSLIYERNVVKDILTFPENLLTTSGLSVVFPGVILLPEVTQGDKSVYVKMKRNHLPLSLIYTGLGILAFVTVKTVNITNRMVLRTIATSIVILHAVCQQERSDS